MKISNFKRVLALVLTFAMVISFCTVGFTANAAATVATTADLSYYVMNDASADNDSGWANKFNRVEIRNLDGDLAYRVTPQLALSKYFNIKNNLGDFTATDLAAVKTLSYYVFNDTGTDFTYRYQYGVDETAPTAYFDGYVYLLDAKTGELLPVFAKHGNITLPAGFKGYVIYDLSEKENYGKNIGKTDYTVNIIKNERFKGMGMRVVNTEAMLTKAWYLDEFAISTKSIGELADYLSDMPVSFVFNQASAAASKNGVVYEGKTDPAANSLFTGWDSNSRVYGTVVDFPGLEGKGLQYTTQGLKSKANNATLAVNSIYDEARGTARPFAIEKVEGISWRVNFNGEFKFDFCVNDEANKLVNVTYYYLGDDGSISVNKPSKYYWSGTIYAIFSDSDVTVATGYNNAASDKYTWAQWVDLIAKEEKKISFILYTSTSENSVAGETLTYGSFGFIYDSAAVVDSIFSNNYVLSNASDVIDTNTTANHSFTVVDNEDSYGGKEIKDTTLVAQTDDGFKTTVQSTNIPSPEKVNAIAFRIKVPNINSTASGKSPTFRFGLNGDKVLYNYADYGTTAKLINYDGTVTNPATRPSSENPAGIIIPDAFDGIVVLDVSGEGKFKVNGTATSFSGYAASNTISHIYMFISNKWNQLAGDIYTIDDFMLIYEDTEEYIERIAAEKASNIYNRSYVMNNASARNGMTSSAYNMFANSGNKTATGVHPADNNLAFAITQANGDSARPAFTMTRGETLYGSAIDFKKAKAFSLWVSVPDLGEGNYYTVTGAFGNGNKYADYKGTVYAISDDGKTVITSDKKINLNGFTGRIYYLFDDSAVITYDKVDYTWESYYAYSSRPTMGYAPWTARNFKTNTIGETPIVLYYDDFRFHFNDSMLADAVKAVEDYETSTADAAADAAKRAESVYNDASNITSKTFGGYSSLVAGYTGRDASLAEFASPFDVAVDTEITAPGTATSMKFTRNENVFPDDKDPQYSLWIKNTSDITKEEIAKKEAMVFWVKVPEGESIKLADGLKDQKYFFKSSTMTYNLATKEYKLYEEGNEPAYSGFEGYVIVPLKNALVGSTVDNSTYLKNELANTDFKITDFVSYFWTTKSRIKFNTNSSFWLGDFRLVDSISGFFSEIGVETTVGDVNDDGSVDVRDTVRLKKFNADPSTPLAYQNADIDGNGLFDTAIELTAGRKQISGVNYTVEEDASFAEYPDVMVGLFHGGYGSWDSRYSDRVAEEDIVNTYITTDIYELAQIKKNGGSAWIQLSRSFTNTKLERVEMFAKFDEAEGKYVYDAEITVINPEWAKALDEMIKSFKANKVWNAVVGFATEEIFPALTTDQYIVFTKYLKETYGKRFFAILDKDELNAANYETYQYVTDIAYDDYDDTPDQNAESFDKLKKNIQTKTSGETVKRTDIKYWFFPTAYSPFTTNASGEISFSFSDETVEAQIKTFAKMLADVPEAQRGGLFFYNWLTFSKDGTKGAFGLDKLIGHFNYEKTAAALIKAAKQYVK